MDRLAHLNLAERGQALLIAFLFSMILCIAAQASLIPHVIIPMSVP